MNTDMKDSMSVLIYYIRAGFSPLYPQFVEDDCYIVETCSMKYFY